MVGGCETKGDMSARRPGHSGVTLLGLGLITALVTGCAAPSPASPSIAGGAATTAAPASPGAPPLASPASSASPPAGTGDPEDIVMEQLFLAIGNPDTGSESEAWTAFMETLKEAIAGRGDPERTRATAQVVLDHLAAAHSALTAATASPRPTTRVVPAPSPSRVPWDWGQEWDIMLTVIGEGVTTMRDGGLAGDVNMIAAGSSRMNDALLDRFYPPNTWTSPEGLSFYASGTRLTDPPGNAFDRQADSSWIAGDRPLPGWIEVDLGTPRTIEGVRLLTSQDIAGPTVHRVSGRTADGKEVILAEFRGTTQDNQWLEQTLATPQADVIDVRVTTSASPALVAWREIEILSPDLPLPSLAAIPTPRPRPSAVPVENRLADGRVIRASSATSASPPSGAFDGMLDSGWNAGDFPVAWIEVDFGHPVVPTAIRLLTSQSPDGHTIHNIYGRVDGQTAERLLHTFDGITGNVLWLSADLASPGPIRYLRIETATSPSWVGWFEIEVTIAP
jgi:hypothetical protein